MFFFLLFHSSVIHNLQLNSSGVALEDKRDHAKQKSNMQWSYHTAATLTSVLTMVFDLNTLWKINQYGFRLVANMLTL